MLLITGVKRMDTKAMVGVGIGLVVFMLVCANILPTALTTWSEQTAVGGAMENETASVKNTWNMVPIFAVLAVLLLVIGAAISHYV